jgi:hypothetical protein
VTSQAKHRNLSQAFIRCGTGRIRWRADGKELFFIALAGAIASVPVTADAALEVGAQTTLFQAPGIATDWGVSADGSRFLVLAPEVPIASTSFSLIFDWQTMLGHER